MITVHPETVEEASMTLPNGKVWNHQTIEITINGDRRRVYCAKTSNGDICIHGFAIRFPTGAKVWEGTAWYYKSTGVLNHSHPKIDSKYANRGSVVGFYEDFKGTKTQSNHNAV